MAEPILSVRNVSIAFDGSPVSRVVEDVSFDVRRGTTFGIVGESGSGKSTIGLSILGLLPPSCSVVSGAITFQGRELTGMTGSEHRSLRGNQIAMVFQDPFSSLNPALTIGRQIGESLIFHQGKSASAAKARVLTLLDEVQLPRARALAQAYPHQLSGGMKQRVLIAAALACRPNLLLLDEPTTALDVTTEAQIIDMLQTLKDEYSLSMIFISHNLQLVSQICDDLCVLYSGTIMEGGAAADVLAAPQHPYTIGLLSAAPDLASPRRRLATIPGTLPSAANRPTGCIFMPRCRLAEAHCREPQALIQNALRLVRCWKAAGSERVRPRVDRSESAAEINLSQAQQLLLEVRDLQKIYRRNGRGILSRLIGNAPRNHADIRSVDGISLTVNRGEVVGILGESGSGKTTLARCIVGLTEPTRGSIRIIDADGQQIPRGTRSVQMVFQNPASSLNPRRKVGDIIGRPLALNRYGDKAARRRRVEELLDLVQLPLGHITRYPRQLSGGERQRVGIARALASSPQLIICDEPVSALDVSVQAAVLNLLEDLRSRLGISYLFISHDIAVVAHVSDRILIMFGGQVVEQGRVSEVLAAPYHPYTAELMRAARKDRSATGLFQTRGADTTQGCKFYNRCPLAMAGTCDIAIPHLRSSGGSHEIACHIPAETLRRAIDLKNAAPTTAG